MNKFKRKLFFSISALVDLLLLVISFLMASNLVFKTVTPQPSYFLIPFLGCTLIWFVIGIQLDLYDNSKQIHSHNVFAKNSLGLFFFSLASSGFLFLITDYKYSRHFLIDVLFIHAILILLWKISLFLVEKSIRKKTPPTKNVVIVGYNSQLDKLISTTYNNSFFDFKLKAVFTDENVLNKMSTDADVAQLDKAINYIKNHKIDQLLISLKSERTALLNELLKIADNNLIRVHIIPEFSDYLPQLFSIDYIANIPLLKLRDEPLKSLTNRILKRGIDVFLSLLAVLFLFSWLFPIIMILIKLESKGPVFFKQKRTGRDGEDFSCLKFRSMKVNSESNSKQATKNDARVTKVGHFLRKTSLDELPQIINVLKNEMSLVGPRPHMLKHTKEYKELVDKFMVRHYAKPGITGWAQINGHRGETKEVEDMKKRAEADIWYIENWSVFLDIKIIVTTIFVVFIKKDPNAY